MNHGEVFDKPDYPPVHLSVPLALKVLKEAPMRDRQINYLGYWWDIARTSLIDDVATVLPLSSSYEVWHSDLLKRVNYGVRLARRYDGSRSFRIIDCFSDG